MKKVLIITYSFPPLNNIASRRFGEIAPHLLKHGWDPYILTTESEGTLSVDLSEEQIFRCGYHPQKSLKISSNKNKSLLKKLLDVKRSLGFNLRLFDRTYFNWYKEIKDEDNFLKEKEFDLIVASFGPAAALYLGKYLSKKHSIPWIADFRDLGALYKDNYFKQNSLFKSLDMKIEESLLSDASAITSIGNTLTSMLEEKYKKPSYTIFNGWKENITEPIEKSNSQYIYYAGRFYPHQMNSVFLVIDILKKYKDLKLVIRSLGPNDLNQEIIKYAKRKEVYSQIKLLEPTEQNIILKESQASLANLVVEDLNEDIYWKKGTLTGKLLGLLPLEPPILAVARSDSEIGEILEHTNKGRLCSNHLEIEEFILTTPNYSPKNISFYSKENQASILANIFSEVIK